MASEKERTRVFLNEPGVFEVATNKKVRLEVNDNQSASSDITVTFPSTTGTLAVTEVATGTMYSTVTTNITYTGAISGGLTITDCVFHKIGKCVTAFIKQGEGTSDTPGQFLQAAAAVPEGYRPANNHRTQIRVSDDGTAKLGTIQVNTTGTIILTTDWSTLAAFTGGGGNTGATDDVYLTWLIP